MKGGPFITVKAARSFPVTVEKLWRVAGHPVLLSKSVPMLARFTAPRRLWVGARVAELHTILGIPQRYLGRIIAFREGEEWGMTNEPQGKGVFPLPHQVLYQFQHTSSAGSSLFVTCDFACGGMLRFPGVRLLAEWFMKRTLNRLLDSLYDQLSGEKCAATTPLRPA